MTIQRRTIVQGIVWGTPAIVAVSAAPAFAVSQLQTLITHGNVSSKSDTSEPPNLVWVRVDMSAYGGSTGSAGFTISNTAAGASITATKLILWYPMSGLNFTPDPTSAGWTFTGTTSSNPPAGMPAGYTGYVFEYPATVTATAGSTTYGATPNVNNLAMTANVSPTPYVVGVTFYQQSFATYNGTPLTFSSSGGVKPV